MVKSRAGEPTLVTTAFEGSSVALALFEGDPLRVAAANAVSRELFGARLGASALDVFARPGMTELPERLDEVGTTGRPYNVRSLRTELADDQGLPVEVFLDISAQPVAGPDGQVQSVALTGVDATAAVRSRRAREARAFERGAREQTNRDLVTSLQDAMMADGLPMQPGVDLAAHYLIAESDGGGDWFDVIALDDGRVVLAVGDVVGHGLQASAVMGELRAIFDEHVRASSDIAAALTLLDRRAQRSPATRAATVCAVLLDPVSGDLTYCTAGHPPPLVIGPGGGATYLAPSGASPLGMGRPFRTAEHRLGPDDLLVLYSDGLVDRPHRTPTGNTSDLTRLAQAVHGRETTSPEHGRVAQRFSAGLLHAATRQGYADDVTIVAARLMQPVPDLRLSLPVDADSQGEVRRRLGEWLTRLEVRPIDETVLQHSVGELVGNVVEHAYRSSTHRGRTDRAPTDRARAGGAVVEVVASHRPGGDVELTVADHGTWRAPDPSNDRGHGLAMVQGFCDDFELSHDDSGTRACLRHRPRLDAVLLTGSSTGVPAVESPPAAFVRRGVGMLAVSGVVEGQGVDRLRHQLGQHTQGGTVPLLLDLTEVGSLSSAAVQVLSQAVGRGSSLRLLAPFGTPAQHSLDLAGLAYLTTTPPDGSVPH